VSRCAAPASMPSCPARGICSPKIWMLFSLSSGQSFILSSFLVPLEGCFSAPARIQEVSRVEAAVNIAVGTSGGGAKRC